MITALARQSVTDPRAAARAILAADLPQGTIWTGFALVVVTSAFIVGLTPVLMPDTTPLPAPLDQPAGFAVFMAIGVWLLVHGLVITGRLLGGAATPAAMLALVVWVQALRATAQAAMLVLMLLPGGAALSAGLSILASLVGLWITLAFIDEAHCFGSWGKSALVLIMSGFGVAIGLSLLWALFGLDPIGRNA